MTRRAAARIRRCAGAAPQARAGASCSRIRRTGSRSASAAACRRSRPARSARCGPGSPSCCSQPLLERRRLGGACSSSATLRRLVGLHGHGARISAVADPGADRLGRDRRLLARALAGDAGRLLRRRRRLRAVPLLRRRQAGPVAWADQRFKPRRGAADRLGAGLRHPVRRLRRRALHAARDRAVEVRAERRRRRRRARSRALADALRARGCDAGHRRVLHRRPDRRRLHRARRLERLVRARLRHLLERGQDRAARRRRRR